MYNLNLSILFFALSLYQSKTIFYEIRTCNYYEKDS